MSQTNQNFGQKQTFKKGGSPNAHGKFQKPRAPPSQHYRNSNNPNNPDKNRITAKPRTEGKWKTIEHKGGKCNVDKIKLIDEVIEKIQSAKTVKRLLLQDNGINDQGIIRLMTFLMNTEGIQIKNLYFFKNEIGDIGAESIAEFLHKIPLLPNEIHLSHNKITMTGARKIFSAIKSRDFPILRNTEKGKKLVPLWLRLEWNLMDTEQIEPILNELGISYCSAKDRTQCTPVSCHQSVVPQLHLYVVHLQYKPVEESTLLKDTKKKALKTRTQPPPSITSFMPAPQEEVPTMIFLDTNAVLNMMSVKYHNRAAERKSAKHFTWKNLIEKAVKNQFGYSCFGEDGDKVCLLLTNTVMQEVDHQKVKNPFLRPYIVEQLQAETGFLSQCATLKFLEVLGSHQGERLVKDQSQQFIDMARLNNPNLENDIALINVALFWNAEIAKSGTVILITGDLGCLKMAKEHRLPAATLMELDENLGKVLDQPWSAKLIKQCIPSASRVACGETLGSPLATKNSSLFEELQNAVDITRDLMNVCAEVPVEFNFPYFPEATWVALCGDFDLGETHYLMVKTTTTQPLITESPGAPPSWDQPPPDYDPHDDDSTDDYSDVIDDLTPLHTSPVPSVPFSSSVTSVPSVPSVSYVPSVTYVPSVPSVSSVPSVPSVSSVPSVVSVPSIPSVPPVPSVASVPSVPSVASVPSVPSVPSVSSVPPVPSVSSVPSVPSVSSVPSVPTLPSVSTIPSIPKEHWMAQLLLRPRTYMYRYMVDGTWAHNPCEPITVDLFGNVINFVTVAGPPDVDRTMEEAAQTIKRWQELLSSRPTFAKK